MQNTDLYDEDTNTYFTDPNTYCEHGTYIGTPGGPDILCGWCEAGATADQFEAYVLDTEFTEEMRNYLAAMWAYIGQEFQRVEGPTEKFRPALLILTEGAEFLINTTKRLGIR